MPPPDAALRRRERRFKSCGAPTSGSARSVAPLLLVDPEQWTEKYDAAQEHGHSDGQGGGPLDGQCSGSCAHQRHQPEPTLLGQLSSRFRILNHHSNLPAVIRMGRSQSALPMTSDSTVGSTHGLRQEVSPLVSFVLVRRRSPRTVSPHMARGRLLAHQPGRRSANLESVHVEQPMEQPRGRRAAEYLPTAVDSRRCRGDSWQANSPIGSGWPADMRYPEVSPLRTLEARLRHGGRTAAGVNVRRAWSGGCSSMAEHQLPKLTVRVRFPSSAPTRCT